MRRSAARLWAGRRGLARYGVRNAGTVVRMGGLDLQGRSILITGGSSGIGFATAHRCLEAGARVAIIARDCGELERARAELSDHGTVFAHGCDVTDEAQVSEMVAATLREFGHIDVLVNNAGRSIRRSTINSVGRMHDYRRTMDVNYYGAVGCTLEVLPGMLDREAGRIVNVSSIATQFYGARFGAYAASKSALDAFGDVLAGEVAGRGVTVTSVKMPLTRTPMIEPTVAYRSVSTISPERAAGLVLQAIRFGRPRVSTVLGRMGEVAVALTPGSSAFWRHVDYLLVPESSAALGRKRNSEKDVATSEVVQSAECEM